MSLLPGQKQIEIAAKLYKARDLCRRLWPENYAAEIRDYQEILRRAMEQHRCSELEAALLSLRLLQEKEPGSGLAQMWVMAAVVEMIEPSGK